MGFTPSSVNYRDPSLLSRVGISSWVAVEIKEKGLGISLDFINLSGDVRVSAYRPDQEANDIALIGEEFVKVYEEGSYASRSW